ncbi:MAG: UDP-N-acetylglucosamine 2-epimerase (non-hydrolyzing) [Firmicutes bacterium]|jgi:UDP-N-acetylglucosamine 2-epimerase (non-hydrolysing)|nr:UDP-N-acetylglucosamine 2-epimerase (non-hydrolyzing) [Bacillota bacterium]MDH7494362.1 UDP-N-acetylglucosamine 2-epimerase (non-hydrolyzing) [Bacillota bacterium]
MSRKKVMLVFGTRPEAIKMAPVVSTMQGCDAIKCVVAVTAQHREMLDQVLDLFDVEPDYDLDIMREGQSLADIATRAIAGLEAAMAKEKPDLVLVHGDTSTTFIASLVAFYHQVQVGHVEAGLRTHDKYSPFPEEMNRRLTGCLADIHFAPVENHKRNLLAEGVREEAVHVTGNTVIDALIDVARRPYEFRDPVLAAIDFDHRKVLLVTAHRRENWGEPMREICHALKDIVDARPDVEIVFPVHMNPLVRTDVIDVLGGVQRVHLIDPVDYQAMVALMKRCYMVLTDSGGLQEEAPSLDKPVVVLRNVTERPEGLEAGTLVLAGTDRRRIVERTRELLEDPEAYQRMACARNPYGDGHASERILAAVLWRLGICRERPEDFCG